MKKTHILPLIGLSLCAASLAQTPDEQAPIAPAAEQPTPTEAPTPAAPAAEQPAPTEAPAPVAPAAEQPAPPTEAPAPAAPAVEQPTPTETPAPAAPAVEQPTPTETPAPAAPAAEQPAPTGAPAPAAPAAEQPTPPTEAPAPAAPAAAEPPTPTEAPAPAAPVAEQPAPPTEAPAPDASPKEQVDSAPAPKTPPSPEEIREVLSYFLGYRTGQNMTQVGPIKMDDIDVSLFVAALADGIMGNPPDQKIREKDLSAIMDEYEKQLQARTKDAVAKNIELSNKKAEEYAKEEGVQKLPSGILAKELSPGSGAKYDGEKDGKNAIVSISYQLRLLNDTTVDESAEPIEMPIDNMLPSIVDGIKQMPVGAEWELFIPSDKGYGEQGMGPLKCCTPFMFKVKLHGIKKAPAPTGQPMQLTPEVIKQLQEQGLQPSKA